MANTLTFIDMVAREAQSVAHEKTQFIATTDRQYDSSFGQAGAKIGSTLRVRKPNQYLRRQGSRVMDVQDQAEATQTVTVATQDGVDMRFNSAELALDTENVDQVAAFTKRYIEPAVSSLVSGIEADYLAFATKATYQCVGSANTANTTLQYFGAARAKLNQQLAPKDRRCIQMDSVGMGNLVNGVAAYFAPPAQIAEQYREGLVKRTSMADWYENERVWTMTTGADQSGALNLGAGVALGNGVSTMVVDGFTAAPAVGTIFTMASTYDVHPETKAVYPHLKQFTVVSATTTSITFSPPHYNSTTDPRQNCSGATDDNDVIAVLGDTSSSYVMPLMYHPEAFQFVTADLPLMDDAHKCTRRMKDGISLRVWQASDIRNDEMLMRIDILYGMAALRPEWACRLIGAKNA